MSRQCQEQTESEVERGEWQAGWKAKVKAGTKGEQMKKIPSLFLRNPDNMAELTTNLNPNCIWVWDGEGVPTRKWDGTAVRIDASGYFKRYDAKVDANQQQPIRPLPTGFIPADTPDMVTGHWPGWVPIELDGKTDQPFWTALAYEREILAQAAHIVPLPIVPTLPFDTYELCGPKVNNNPEQLTQPVLPCSNFPMLFHLL
jgi:hypothetical protein